jgi:O-antigen/teichoic acid export membrane protein
MFRIVFILLVVRYLVHIGGLLILFLNRNIVSLELIAIIILISNLIPFIINIFIILKVLISLKKTEEDSLTFIVVLKYLIKYGIHLSIRMYLNRLNREFRPQLISIFEAPGFVTGYNIANHYSDVSFEAIGSFNRPLTISFSSLDASNKNDQIEKIFRNLFQYSVLFVLLITGVLVFCADIYVVIIYTASRLEYSLIIKLFVIAMVFNVQASFFYSLLRASEKLQYIVPITLVSISIKFISFLIALIYFGITGAMIGIIIGNVIEFCSISYLNYRIFKIRINIKKTIFLYSSFFIALALALIMESLFLADLNFLILQSINLLFFRHFQFLSFGIFILIFFILIITFKAFTRSDANNLEEIFTRDNFIDKIIGKGLKILRRILRD